MAEQTIGRIVRVVMAPSPLFHVETIACRGHRAVIVGVRVLNMSRYLLSLFIASTIC